MHVAAALFHALIRRDGLYRDLVHREIRRLARRPAAA